MQSFRAQRTLSGGMALLFLATHGLLAYAPETNLWAERRKASRRQAATLLASLPPGPPSGPSPMAPFPVLETLAPSLSQNVARSIPKKFLMDQAKLLSALSPAHGTIRKISFSPRNSPLNPVIVHIQDVHMNPEAQRNIREAVRSLMQSGQVNLVALEGAAKEIRLQPFVDFPNRQAVEATADLLLKENKISGPIHAAMTAQGKLPRILGIDDPFHYQANVQAYRDSAPKLDGARAWVKELKSGIGAEKNRVLSPDLRAFDEKVESYREGKTSLGDYVLLLSSPPRGPTTKQISLFQKALALERTLDFRQVEAERTRLIEALTPTLTKTETDALLAHGLAYRSGQLRYADFYTGLKDLCRKKGIDLAAYPAMDDYVKYVLLADGIDAEKLMEDLAAGEKAVYASLARSEAERRLLANSRRAWLTGKLVDFSLTPVEWREYKTGTVAAPATARSLPSLPPALASFESFYREADARDEAMANNVAEAASPGPERRAAVLVTGGYHAEGIAQALTAKGFTVLSYVPKIEKIDTAQGSAYLSVFTQEKTSLDRLFEGQQLFLANEPVKACDVQLTAPGLIAVADRAKTFGSIEKSFLSLLPPALAARIKKIVVKTSGEVARLNVLFKDGWAYTVGSTPGDSSTGPRFVTEIEKHSSFSIPDGIRRALALVFPLRGPDSTRAWRGPPAEKAEPEGVNGASVLVSADYVPGIYRENELGNEFSEEINDNRQFSRESIIDRQLTLLVLNGELDPNEREEVKRKAVDLLSEAERAPGFNPTTMERDVLTCGIVRKVVNGQEDFNPFSVRNLKTNNVAAALQEDGITLRQRLLRLLYCFEALKHIPNEELYHREEHFIAERLWEKVRSFDDRALAIDAFESYVQRVVRSPKPITVPVFLDDNGETVFVLRFILDQMAMNKNLRFVLVPRNGQYREDASVQDVAGILNSPRFRKEVQSVGDRLRVVPGCAGDGIDVRTFSRELVDVLLSADVVLSIGQMNFEGLNAFKKDLYFFFVSMHLGPSVVSGVPTGKGVFAFLPAGTKAFSNYTDRLFRRLRLGAGVTIPVAGHTLIEAAAMSPENKINEPFEVLTEAPKGQGHGAVFNPSKNPGGSTSRWMTQVFRWLGNQWGGPDAAKRWGAHYISHAPAYEWSLGFGAAAANLAAVFFLAGSAWAMVPLLLTALFLPSHALPARWLGAEVQVDWVKAGVMAAFYFALVAAAPLLAMDFGWTQPLLQAAAWGLTLLLHRSFDPIVDKLPQTWEWLDWISGAFLSWTFPERTTAQKPPSLAESAKTESVGDGIGPSTPLSVFLRRIKTLRPFPGLPFTNPITIIRGADGIYRVSNVFSPPSAPVSTRTARGPPAEKAEPEAVNGAPVLVSKDYVPGIYRENELGKTFWQEAVENQQFSRESIIDRQLTLLVLNGELDPNEREEVKRKAVDLLSEAERAPGFNPTTMERDVLTCGIVRKVVNGQEDFNPFSVRNLKTNNVAAALQEDGITLRQRLLRLLYCFEALKHIPNEELYHREEHFIAERLWEKVRSFDDRALAIDAFESYVQRVVRSPKPITVPVFLDDNGETVFVLRFILDQMAMNKNLRFVLVPRNGQYREDASVQDVAGILNSPRFRKEVQSVGGRLRVVPGCAGDGIDVRTFSRELVDVLLSADVVLSIGQMNFEGLNAFKKDLYFFFISTNSGNSVVTGVPSGKGVFAFLPAGTKAFSNYTDKLFRRLRFGAGVTIPVAGHTLIEAARPFPENKINEPFEVLNDSPIARATSRWMTLFFERLGFHWGGEKSAERWGAHYISHAPAYEWSLGFAMAAANLGAVFFLAGTAGAVAPLLLTALFLPSHVLPARWLKTEVRVDWVKAGLMAAFYFALVAAAPLLAMDFGWTQTVLQAAAWGLTLALHRRFDPNVDKSPPSPEVPGIKNDSAEALLLEQTLTTEQRRFAARITSIVGAKPTRLGLEDYMYGAAQAAVRTAVGNGPAAPALEDRKGTPVLFVDARSVATEKQRTALEAFLKGKPNAVIFTDADDLLIAGADIRVRRGVFSSLRTPEGDLPSGVVEVALAGLGTELGSLARGGGLQLFQTAALKLNARGADEPVAEAANRAWILSDLFTLLSPALAPEKWDDVLKVLTAIARSA